MGKHYFDVSGPSLKQCFLYIAGNAYWRSPQEEE